MKAQVKVNAGLIVDVEAGKQKDLFKGIASAHEVFGEKKCGLCGGGDILPVWRTVTVVKGKKTETFEFPEYHCRSKTAEGRFCGARLALGTINDDTGTLFPQRRLIVEGGKKDMGRVPNKAEKDGGVYGEYGPHNGWTRYKGKAGDDAGEPAAE